VAFDKKNKGWQCEKVNSARAVAMLEIDRKKKALEPLPIGVNNRLKPLINLVLDASLATAPIPVLKGN
jgi:hypothetical protein